MKAAGLILLGLFTMATASASAERMPRDHSPRRFCLFKLARECCGLAARSFQNRPGQI